MDYNEKLKSYRDLLLDSQEVERFLCRIPWILDSSIQKTELLQETLLDEAEQFSEFSPAMVFSIITPLRNTQVRFLEELIYSCLCQSWLHWELILIDDGSQDRSHLPLAEYWENRDARIRVYLKAENSGIAASRNLGISKAHGDFICFLDHDDLLHPQALAVFARYILEKPHGNFFFSNEARISEDSSKVGQFLWKPEFDFATLLRINYLCHLVAIRKDLVEALVAKEHALFRLGFDGVEDHDFFIRLALLDQANFHHIPLFCYYWRISGTSAAKTLNSKKILSDRGQRMLTEHLNKIYSVGVYRVLKPGEAGRNTGFSLRCTGANGKRSSLLIIVLCTGDDQATLKCLNSLEGQAHDMRVKVVVADLGSGKTSPAKIEEWCTNPRRNEYIIEPSLKSFNLARINNVVVNKFGKDCELLLFMSGNIELLSEDCVQQLCQELTLNTQFGFVGIKLWYPNKKKLRHGGLGVFSGFTGPGRYQVSCISSEDAFVHDEHAVMGIGFDCAMVRRELFETLGGLNEHSFPHAFSDVDICLRAKKKGYVNFYFGTLEGVDHFATLRTERIFSFELNLLYAHHAEQLCSSSRHLFGYRNTFGFPTEHCLLPLRYRIADALNNCFKTSFGPLHRLVRKIFSAWG